MAVLFSFSAIIGQDGMQFALLTGMLVGDVTLGGTGAAAVAAHSVRDHYLPLPYADAHALPDAVQSAT